MRRYIRLGAFSKHIQPIAAQQKRHRRYRKTKKIELKILPPAFSLSE